MVKLASSKQWFCDGTFKVSPQGFQQILNIIVYLPGLEIYYPACHLFITHKTQEVYTMALSFLKSLGLSQKNKLNFEPNLITCDFEPALRNSIKSVFPNVHISGCYFHFTKCLWEKISKLGLRKQEFKAKSITLISYLQILVHMPPSRREYFFDQIKEIFANEDSRFGTFFNYFKKNWLKDGFLDELFKALTGNDDLQFVRSNNPCEGFHNFLGKFILSSL